MRRDWRKYNKELVRKGEILKETLWVL